MRCHGCLMELSSRKDSVKSTIQTHSAATKVQKKIKATVTFRFTDGSGQAHLCKSCQKEIIDGMSNGGNFK